jgi:hypothetical protein
LAAQLDQAGFAGPATAAQSTQVVVVEIGQLLPTIDSCPFQLPQFGFEVGGQNQGHQP